MAGDLAQHPVDRDGPPFQVDPISGQSRRLPESQTTESGQVHEHLDQTEADRNKLAAKVAELEEQVSHYRPFVEVALAQSLEDVIEQVGAAHIREIAEIQLGEEDTERIKAGWRPRWDESTERYEEAVQERMRTIAAEFIARQSKWTAGVEKGGHAQLRTVKMVNPRRNCDICEKKACYEHGTQVQIPVELQINNGAASLADPIERYKRKGFKLLAPMRCKLVDCWLPQAIEFGTPIHSGYCSELHRRHIEGRIEHRGPISA